MDKNSKSSGEEQAAQNSLSDEAINIIDSFEALCHRAKDTLTFTQAQYLHSYNNNQLNQEFEVGSSVLINSHALHLLKPDLRGPGKKLQKPYDGPFEIMAKLSPITCRLWLPSSYRIYPVINIAHLEPYHLSPEEFGNRPIIPFNRAESAEKEWEVDSIVAERSRKRGNRRIPH